MESNQTNEEKRLLIYILRKLLQYYISVSCKSKGIFAFNIWLNIEGSQTLKKHSEVLAFLIHREKLPIGTLQKSVTTRMLAPCGMLFLRVSRAYGNGGFPLHCLQEYG